MVTSACGGAVPGRPSSMIGRVSAVALIGCAVVHTVAAVEHLAAAPALAVVTLVAAAACSHCVAELWRAPRRSSWGWATAGSGAMLTLHLTMMIVMAGPPGAAAGHHAAMAGTGTVVPTGGAVAAAGLVLPLLCLGLIWVASGRLPAPVDGAVPVVADRSEL